MLTSLWWSQTSKMFTNIETKTSRHAMPTSCLHGIITRKYLYALCYQVHAIRSRPHSGCGPPAGGLRRDTQQALLAGREGFWWGLGRLRPCNPEQLTHPPVSHAEPVARTHFFAHLAILDFDSVGPGVETFSSFKFSAWLPDGGGSTYNYPSRRAQDSVPVVPNIAVQWCI